METKSRVRFLVKSVFESSVTKEQSYAKCLFLYLNPAYCTVQHSIVQPSAALTLTQTFDDNAIMCKSYVRGLKRGFSWSFNTDARGDRFLLASLNVWLLLVDGLESSRDECSLLLVR